MRHAFPAVAIAVSIFCLSFGVAYLNAERAAASRRAAYEEGRRSAYDPYTVGYLAAVRGDPAAKCPHDLTEANLRRLWLLGHGDAMLERAERERRDAPSCGQKATR